MSHPTKMDDLEGPSPQIHHVETYGQVPLDLDDPHRAALENNPEHSAKLSFKSLMAVNVSKEVPLLTASRVMT
jgi:hypothetical protein